MDKSKLWDMITSKSNHMYFDINAAYTMNCFLKKDFIPKGYHNCNIF